MLAMTLLWAMAAVLSGCQTTGQQEMPSLAAVEIAGNTPGQISAVAKVVFEEDGYELAKPGLTSLIFEKKASGMSNLAYGNWGGTPVWLRVKVLILPLG